MTDTKHLDYLHSVAAADAAFLMEREKTYRGSWKASGGRSAWFMLKRKIDRLNNMMARPTPPADFNFAEVLDDWTADCHTEGHIEHVLMCYPSEDVFAKIEAQPGGEDGTVLAEVRDLRRYLLLVEAEMVARGVVAAPPPQTLHVSEELAAEWRFKQIHASGEAPLTVPEFIEQNAPDHVAARVGPIVPEASEPPAGPGTPEDGGHHERVLLSTEEPWVLTMERSRLIPPPVVEAFYRAYHPTFYVLEPFLSDKEYAEVSLGLNRLRHAPRSRGILQRIQNVYVRTGIEESAPWVLSLAHAPAERRDLWPRLRREHNHKEYGELLTWQKYLYEWSNEKWVLRDDFSYWSTEP